MNASITVTPNECEGSAYSTIPSLKAITRNFAGLIRFLAALGMTVLIVSITGFSPSVPYSAFLYSLPVMSYILIEQMPETVLFRLKVLAVVLAGPDTQRYLLDYLYAINFQPADFLGIVG